MTKFQFFARFGQTILVRKMEEKSNRILPNQAKSHVQDSPVSNNMKKFLGFSIQFYVGIWF